MIEDLSQSLEGRMGSEADVQLKIVGNLSLCRHSCHHESDTGAECHAPSLCGRGRGRAMEISFLKISQERRHPELTRIPKGGLDRWIENNRAGGANEEGGPSSTPRESAPGQGQAWNVSSGR